MLRMSIRNFVLVEALDLDFDPGFTVLTGETGAGKSILIDALQLALGGRADAIVVREGCARAEVSVEFELTPQVTNWLEVADIDAASGLLLRRTVDREGRSRAWINGSAATVAQQRELGELLVDIHGQHAWQNLMKPASSRALLDAYAGLDTSELRMTWDAWRAAATKLEKARAAQSGLAVERERLQWQIAEVEKLGPGQEEWSSLNADHARLSNAQTLLNAARSALSSLCDGETNALKLLGAAGATLTLESQLEPTFAALGTELSSVTAQVEDIAHSLRSYLRHAEPDPRQLAKLDERLSLWMSLSRRYRRAPSELYDLLVGWRSELAALDAGQDLESMSAHEVKAARAYTQAAELVSAARNLVAPKLSAAISASMQTLGMLGGRFEVKLQPREASVFGVEDAEFLVAGHAGAQARSVGRVASGGELSRIALAIAVCTSQLGSAQTLVFDEVDSGVGGAVAETVGRLMKQLGVDRQVLCVTHLPQVAACADQHGVVSKQRGTVQPFSRIVMVSGEHRISEVARMLGGEKLSVTTLAHAKEMLGS